MRELGLSLTFQFTHPGGVRLKMLSIRNKVELFQFTHPGGVRLRCASTSRTSSRFNSRTREGCDERTLTAILADRAFQFTHPGGVRLARSTPFI